MPIFFVISGYLISRSFEKGHDLKNYFRNRILRIYPGLWGCLIVTILTATIFGKINFINFSTIPWVLAQIAGIIYTPDILKNYGFGSYNGSLWTISIELQFYILLQLYNSKSLHPTPIKINSNSVSTFHKITNVYSFFKIILY